MNDKEKTMITVIAIAILFIGMGIGGAIVQRTVKRAYDNSIDTLIDVPAGYYDDFPKGLKQVGARCFPLDTASELDKLVK